MQTYLPVLPHLAGNIVTMLKLIDETLALVIEQKTTDTTESFCRQELDLSLGLVGVDETSRVNLNLLEIDGASADSEGELLTIASTVVAVGGWEVIVFRAVLLQERILGEVRSITTSGKDDGTVCGLSLAAVDVLYADNRTTFVLDKLANAGLLLDGNAVRDLGCEILETFHLGVGNDHTRELGISTVCTGVGVTTKTGDLGEVESELVLQPVDRVTRATSEDGDQIIASKLTGL